MPTGQTFPEVREWMSGNRVEAEAKYPLVGPANEDVHTIMCMGVKAVNLNVAVWVSWRPNQC